MAKARFPELSRLRLTDAIVLGGEIRRATAGARSMEEAARRIVDRLYEGLVMGPEEEPACVLARFFKTHPAGDLDPELAAIARASLPSPEFPLSGPVLVLVATRGARPEWNSRHSSRGHKAIPIGSRELLARSPMITRLVQQLGVEEAILGRVESSILIDREERTYNVFHVPDALGSPYVPAQEEFVAPHGVRSVVGFGALLPSGNLFAVILFTRVGLPEGAAELFRTLALSVQLAILPHDGKGLFDVGRE